MGLVSQFPLLSFALEAEQWLQSVSTKTILEQMVERKVSSVFLSTIKCLGIMSRCKGFFHIQLKSMSSMEEKVFTLGHEIGHTFEFSKEAEMLIDIPEIEEFCDQFSREWIMKNGKENIESFLRNLEQNQSFVPVLPQL